VFVHAPPQQFGVDPEHVGPPHVPQVVLFVKTVVHVPEQHCCPAAQALLQLPQLKKSFCLFVQNPLQQSGVLPEHDLEHVPQFELLDNTLIQLLPQHSNPGAHMFPHVPTSTK
jgi:hypothetical protein